jgi:riboflavin kinase/FMN adenylyltransferase
VDVVAPVEMRGAPISSSRIRDDVALGRMDLAWEGLGRPYSLRGFVVRGDGRGRTLGFPTANLSPGNPEKLLPPSGIYAVRGTLRSGSFAGALHLGPRPTFQGSPPTIELHLLDFAGEIYGEEIRVDFFEYLRPIHAFGSAEALARQIEIDVIRTREVVARFGRHP